MGSYKVTFSVECHAHDDEKFYVVMEIEKELPFVPSKDMVFGFDADSNWYINESYADEVMWLFESQRFLVRLKAFDGDGARHAAMSLAKQGWKVESKRYSDRKQAESVAEQNEIYETVVEVDGLFLVVSKDELDVLQIREMAGKT